MTSGAASGGDEVTRGGDVTTVKDIRAARRVDFSGNDAEHGDPRRREAAGGRSDHEVDHGRPHAARATREAL